MLDACALVSTLLQLISALLKVDKYYSRHVSTDTLLTLHMYQSIANTNENFCKFITAKKEH